YLQGTICRQMARPSVRSRKSGGISEPTLYHPGDHVWLSTWDIRLWLPSKKLSPRYIGPFSICRQISEVTYELTLPDTYCIASTFHASLVKPYVNPVLPLSTEHEVPLPPK
ncbi:hypothetical protein M9458_000723, partial [Cirrhinus mrigala]